VVFAVNLPNYLAHFFIYTHPKITERSARKPVPNGGSPGQHPIFPSITRTDFNR
jgi:hypothetical protein